LRVQLRNLAAIILLLIKINTQVLGVLLRNMWVRIYF
jgi:hypothetical protein